jgi:hypothetical protein
VRKRPSSHASHQLDQRRIDWLHAHFCGISHASNRYLTLLLTTATLSLATFLSSAEKVKAPGFDIEVTRQHLLSVAGLAGLVLCVAYCGNYDKGRHTLGELAKATGYGYGELWIADPAPNLIDFLRFANPTAAVRRNRLDRFLEAMLYPLAIATLLAWFSLLSVLSVITGSGGDSWAWIGGAGVATALFAWRRFVPFIELRWSTLREGESARRTGEHAKPIT